MESKYDYVVFDIETTGLHPESDQICEIAAIGVKDGLPQGLFSTLVAIEGSMPEAAVLNAELSVIMQSYARKMDYCRGELLRIAGEIAEEIGE